MFVKIKFLKSVVKYLKQFHFLKHITNIFLKFKHASFMKQKKSTKEIGLLFSC